MQPSGRSLPASRLGVLRAGDTQQPLRTQLAHQVQEILLQHRRGDLILLLHALKHPLQGTVLLDKVPHPRAHLIEAEVGARLQVEQHGLPVQITKDHVRAERENVLERTLPLLSILPGVHALSLSKAEAYYSNLRRALPSMAHRHAEPEETHG